MVVQARRNLRVGRRGLLCVSYIYHADNGMGWIDSDSDELMRSCPLSKGRV